LQYGEIYFVSGLINRSNENILKIVKISLLLLNASMVIFKRHNSEISALIGNYKFNLIINVV